MEIKQAVNMRMTIALSILASMLISVTAQGAQSCHYDSIRSAAPQARFADNGDGTLTDTVTKLQWKRCSEGQVWNGSACSGGAVAETWQLALQRADAAEFAGHRDWRLPNIKELGAIVERACTGPALDSGAFPQAPASTYWSSSPGMLDGDSVWVIRFENGYSVFSGKAERNHVRLVRDGG